MIVSPVGPKEKEDIVSFLSSFSGEQRLASFWRRRLQLWWEENPAWDDGLVGGWISHEAGKIIGFTGSIPFLLKVGPDIIRAFSATTWRVLPAYRNNSISLILAAHKYCERSVCFRCTPSSDSKKIFTAMKLPALKKPWDCSHVFFPSILKRAYDTAENRVFRYGLNRLDRFVASCRASKKRFLNSGLRVCRADQPDKAFDELWDNTKDQHFSTRVRTSKALRWYVSGPGPTPKKLYALYDEDKLSGYAVFREISGSTGRALECLDLWTNILDSGRRTEALVLHVIEAAGKEGYNKVVVPAYHQKGQNFDWPAALRATRPDASQRFFYATDPIKSSLLCEDVYFPLGEGDMGF